MNFFKHQDLARRNTKILILFYLLAVVCIVVLIYLAAVICVHLASSYESSRHAASSRYSSPTMPPMQWWNPDIFGYVAIATVLLIIFGTLYKIAVLSKGGEAVAELLGGVPVLPNTEDPDERKLLNVVEEMAIASGTSVPRVYLFKQEYGINAFAAGFSTQDAVVGVTYGCLKLLNRDELQGVIAHEFSHIMNGDMRLNLRLMGILFGILMIAVLGQGILRGTFWGRAGGSRRGGGGAVVAIMLMGFALMTIGYVGVFFARLIKSAISRQREFLADASAVQYTRFPGGLAGALKKIGGLENGSHINHSKAEEVSHLYFADGIGNAFAGFLATHPPLGKRVALLEPGFDGKYPKVEPLTKTVKYTVYTQEKGFTKPLAGAKKMAFQGGAASALLPENIASQVGAPTPEHMIYAAALLEELPGPLKENARDPVGARALIYALLVDREDEDVRKKQLKHLFGYANNYVYQQTQKILEMVQNLDSSFRLPLIDIALPAIKTVSPQQYEIFRKNIQTLIMADEKVDDFEFALKQVVFHHLDASFGRTKPPRTKVTSINAVWPASVELLSFLAHMGCTDPPKAEIVFRDALKTLDSKQKASMIPFEKIRCEELEKGLHLLATASPRIKERFIQASAVAVQHDGVVTPEEAEIIRAFADTLDCPLPPFLSTET